MSVLPGNDLGAGLAHPCIEPHLAFLLAAACDMALTLPILPTDPLPQRLVPAIPLGSAWIVDVVA